MAVMLKSGARTTAASTLPMRSCTIHIAQTGLIEKVVGQNNETLQVVNLGFQGDKLVTRVKVQLWKEANVFTGNYEAAMVFYSEVDKSRQTLTMSSDGLCFFIDVPQQVTKTSGSYQLYFILRENTSATNSGGGIVGVEDDIAYREVFVSDVRKGNVDGNSGYSLISGFNWDTDIYNYELGALRASEWEEDGDAYLTTIPLVGAKLSFVDEITVNLPEGVVAADYDQQPGSWKTYTNKNLTLRVRIAGTDINILEQIEVIYPVTFTTANVDSNAAQKTPIKVQHTASKVSVTENSYLGMKHDAYITPVDVTNLITLPQPTKKYTIFTNGTAKYICEADQYNKCWIPIGVTNTPGMWNVSFIGRSEDYEYYTGILKLEVKNNILTQKDINSDSIYQAVIDEGLNYLVNTDDFIIYAISDEPSTVKIDFEGKVIERAIGWVVGLINEGYDEDSIVNNIRKIDTVNTTIEALSGKVTALETTVGNDTQQIQQNKTNIESLKTKDGELEADIKEIQDVLDTLDVGDLPGRVSDLERTVSSDTKQVAQNTTDIQNLKSTDVTLANTISGVRSSVGTLESKVALMDDQIGEINKTIEPYKSYGDLILNEASQRTAADTNLQTQINETNSMLSSVQTIVNNNIPNALATESQERRTADEQQTKTINELSSTVSSMGAQLTSNITRVDDHQTKISTLEATAVKGVVDDMVYVAKIKFLSTMEEYQALVDADQLDSNTLYLIQEEE